MADLVDFELGDLVNNLAPLQRAYVAALAVTGAWGKAAVHAEVSRTSVFRWKRESVAFREACELAMECASELLEDEARRRAVDGVVKREKRDGDGNLLEREIVYSDKLLELLLKASNPSKYNRAAVQDPTATGEPFTGVVIEAAPEPDAT